MNNYEVNYREWLNNPYFDKKTKEELLSIENNQKEIEDRFYKNFSISSWYYNTYLQ